MFIQTESTPNPNSLKFLPGQDMLGQGARDFATVAEAEAGSPLAAALFQVDGVKRVFLGPDFVTVTKAEDVDWSHIKAPLLGAIMDHFVAGRPVVIGDAGAPAAAEDREIVYTGDAAEIVDQLKELIETRVRPGVAQDGGDIVFHSWDHETGVVKLHMRGACAGCPSSTLTLKQGIENLLRHYVPEVTRVEQVI
jgi:Fe-S cluster biogenesis protein NfuA